MASAARLLVDDDYTQLPGTHPVGSQYFGYDRHFVFEEAKIVTVDPGLVPGMTIKTSVPPVDGLVEVVEALHRLKMLPAGWDSYRARPVALDAVKSALTLSLEALHRCARPHMVPTSDGGINMTWGSDARTLEIEAAPTGSFAIFFCDEAAEIEEDTGPGQTFAAARHALSRYCSGG